MGQKMPPLQWLRSFEAAARHLSFTSAAEELHITQSAVSQQVKQLESFLGQALFVRQPRSLQLTDAARNYLPAIQGAFKLLLKGTQSFFGHDADASLEIKANWAFTVLWLVPRLDSFLQANPWVHLNLSTALWSSEYAQSQALVEVRFGSGEWEGVVGERLSVQECFPVCSPALSDRLAVPEDIAKEPLLHVSGMMEGWDEWFHSVGLRTPVTAIHHQSPTFIVTLALAQRGLGVSLAHDIVAGDLLAAGALCKPLSQTIPMQESYYLLSPDSSQTNKAASAFRDWLLGHFG